MTTLAGLTVLVTDDTDNNLMLFTALLEAHGASVHAASSGEACLAQVETVRPDIILLDIQMPGLDGYETLDALKHGPAADVPVIALTAHAMSGDRETILERGFSGYIAKPVDTRAFPGEVAALCAACGIEKPPPSNN